MSVTLRNTIVRAFNSTLEETMESIHRLYEENPHIVSGKISIKKMISANPSMIIQIWHTYIYLPYKDDLTHGGIDFFFNKDYAHDLQYMGNAQFILEAIEQIREPMQLMDADNKEKLSIKLKKLNEMSAQWKKII